MEIDKIKIEVNNITKKIYTKLKNGFPDTIYVEAFKYELIKSKIKFVSSVNVQIMYEGHIVGNKEIDFIIENKLVLIIKSYKTKSNTTEANFAAYLRTINYDNGMLINFSTEDDTSPAITYFPK